MEELRSEERLVQSAIAFTTAYRQNRHAHRAIREARCLAAQFPALLMPIREDDLFAGIFGRSQYLVKVSIQGFDERVVDGVRIDNVTGPDGDPASLLGGRSQQAGYCVHTAYMRYLAVQLPEYREQLGELITFWETENTWSKFHAAWPPHFTDHALADGRPYTRPAGDGPILHIGINRVAGSLPDYDKLLRLGLPGLVDEILDRRKQATTDDERSTLDAMLMTIDTVKACCSHYAVEARLFEDRPGASPSRKADVRRIADALDALREREPRTLFEAIQLYRLYAVMAETLDCGRMDVFLGDFCAADVDAGRIDDEEAIRMLASLWRLIDDFTVTSGGRISLGGRDRRNEENANRFAILAMETTRREHKVLPTMTLRFYQGLDERVIRKAYDVIGEGCLYPMLYNDELCIDGVARAMNVPEEDAARYLPLGCGEYALHAVGIGSPNTAINVAKALEATLHDGLDPVSGRRIGPATGAAESLVTYDDVYRAFQEQVTAHMKVAAEYQSLETEIEERESAFLLNAILTDDCVKRAAGLLDGVRYRGGCTEGFGFTNAAESLYAIKRVVFDEQRYTLRELVAILDSDYEDREDVRRELLALSKYGNDEADVDAVVHEVNAFCNQAAKEAAEGTRLHYFIVSSVNPGGVRFGWETGASADGRRRSDSFSVGNSPVAGRDRCGVTALCNSVRGTPVENGGYITNFKFSKEMFNHENRPKTEALLGAFFDGGGQQANVTVVGRGDLEDAMEHPENYPNLLVRVGGRSARFIDLEPRIQQEVLHRTIY